jgi:hypothetical protein
MNDVNQSSPATSSSSIVDLPLTSTLANENSSSNNIINPSQSGEEENKENKEATNTEDKEDSKPEYPMDTVLTLMQLNAGWKQ